MKTTLPLLKKETHEHQVIVNIHLQTVIKIRLSETTVWGIYLVISARKAFKGQSSGEFLYYNILMTHIL